MTGRPVEWRPDPADRRRTIVQIISGQAALIGHWLDGAANDWPASWTSSPTEKEAFITAMDLLKRSYAGKAPTAEPGRRPGGSRPRQHHRAERKAHRVGVSPA